MAADVQEGAQLPFAVSRDDDRNVTYARREIPSTVAQFAEMADVLPGAGEDQFALTPEGLGIRVPRPGQRPLHCGEL